MHGAADGTRTAQNDAQGSGTGEAETRRPCPGQPQSESISPRDRPPAVPRSPPLPHRAAEAAGPALCGAERRCRLVSARRAASQRPQLRLLRAALQPLVTAAAPPSAHWPCRGALPGFYPSVFFQTGMHRAASVPIATAPPGRNRDPAESDLRGCPGSLPQGRAERLLPGAGRWLLTACGKAQTLAPELLGSGILE